MQNKSKITNIQLEFESFVNSERCKTDRKNIFYQYKFESFVNSERCKTIFDTSEEIKGLRALLIQKDAKL